MMARILVIDDDAEMRVLAEQILKSSKHEVVLAADGNEGMKKFRANPADLVIINLYMPDQEGLETIIELRRFFPEVGVMAMSSRAASRTMLAVAQALGATEVLQKPFFAKEMLTAVERVLRSNYYLCKRESSSGTSFDCLTALGATGSFAKCG